MRVPTVIRCKEHKTSDPCSKNITYYVVSDMTDETATRSIVTVTYFPSVLLSSVHEIAHII